MAAAIRHDAVALSTLLAGIVDVPARLDREIDGLTLDSRNVEPGGLFLACRGVSQHGLDFAQQAANQGAAAVAWESDESINEAQAQSLCEQLNIPLLRVPHLSTQVSLIAARFYNFPSQHLLMVGITGTNGKTSVSHLLAQALQPTSFCAIVGTLGVGYPESLSTTGYTTPDAVTLQQLLSNLKHDGAQAIAMEVSSHALDQHRAAAVHFDTAIFTNISRDHFDYHGNMENYAAAKQRLFIMPGLRSAIINLDDSMGRELPANLASEVDVLFYTLDPEREIPRHAAGWVRAESVEPTSRGLKITISSHWGNGEFRSSLLGRFNAANLLAVLLVLMDQGWPLADALQQLAGLKTVEGRMETYGGGDLPAVVIDYAHTPDALEKALLALFGCGGDRDRGKRPLMGEICASLADKVILTDDNPRSEPGDQIIDEILMGIADRHLVVVERDRSAAIRLAIHSAKPGDLVLVAGKGHEDYQLVAGKTLHFSDQEQVLSALASRAGEAG